MLPKETEHALVQIAKEDLHLDREAGVSQEGFTHSVIKTRLQDKVLFLKTCVSRLKECSGLQDDIFYSREVP